MTTAKIPYGDEKVTVELTIKELQVLAGIRFHSNHELEISARKKLNSVLEGVNERESRDNAPIPYQLLS
ncbi:hypothetical protein ACX1C1_26205 [Paenibacillus sp. strain BS8-2]